MTSPIPIIIVAFRNPGDVARCLEALSDLAPVPASTVHICENGGAEAVEVLLQVLTAPGGPCRNEGRDMVIPTRMRRVEQLRFSRPSVANSLIQVGEAQENLGYAGGVNAWLKVLLKGAWPGVWILNPDTRPEPAALAELVAAADRTGTGLIGSRLVAPERPGFAAACGLRWRRWRAATANISSEDAEFVRRTIDAPSGASVYVTRDCLDRIGLMEEQYFLYFEDLDWGLRAKARGGVGYAETSVVVHDSGTTIGSAATRQLVSPLSVYLDFRNRLLFVRRNFPGWLAWTIIVEIAELAAYMRVLAWNNAAAALRGLAAGIRGQSGRPEGMLERHRVRNDPSRYVRDGFLKRLVKFLISLFYFGFIAAARWIARRLRMPSRSRLCIICYHGVRADQQVHFARQMHALKRWAHVVRADWQGEPEPKPHVPVVAITFDDAFENLHEHALLVLERLGLPCTIFAPTGYLGRSPQWRMETSTDRVEQVMTAARLAQFDSALVTIGSHSVTHPHLTALSPEDAQRELEESRVALERLVSRPVRLFAFPYGDHNADLVALCRDCGYTQAFTVEPTLVRPGDTSIARGRVVVNPEDGPVTFYLKVNGAYTWMAAAGAFKRALLRRIRPNAKPWYLDPVDER